MRKILNSMILGLSATLALVGCGGTTYPDAITEWRSDDVTAMNEALGRVIPVAPFSSNYISEHYEVNGYGMIIYCYDETIDDRSEAYGKNLLKNGYELYRTIERSEGYERDYYYSEIENDGTDFFIIQTDYLPGDDDTSARFEVYAWIEDGDKYVYEWPAEAIAEALGTTETVPSFEAENYRFYYHQPFDRYIVDGITVDTTIEETYSAILESANWTIDDSEYEQYGYLARSPGGELSIQYYYDANTISFFLYLRAYEN